MRNKRERIRRAMGLLLAVASLMIGTAPFLTSSGLAYAQAPAPSWSNTGSLHTGRAWHTATLLSNGKVLVVGGSIDNRALDSVELYDPATGTWSFTGSLNVARWGHTATLLPNGKVLIAGGFGARGILASAEIYDTATGIFTAIANMAEAQSYHTATLLISGKVLITGGYDGSADLAAVPELYDPVTGTFVSTGNYADRGAGSVYGMTGLVGVPATLLPNGKVLIVAEPRAELYDPVSGTFSLTGAMATERFGIKPGYIGGRTATLLRSGKVLVTGGAHEDLGRFSSAELYDPSTGTFTPTGDMTRARDLHTATLLPDGRVLITGGETEECANGGCSFAGSTAGTEIFDPATGTFSSVGDMTARRELHTATILNNGRVLITGGGWYAGIGGFMGMLATAELYNPGISAGSNPVDDAQFFVRQHYLDFLNREPDAPGLAHWAGEITACDDPSRRQPGESFALCIERQRTNTSAAFFLSPEFRYTGYYVYLLYKGSLIQNGAGRFPTYQEFLRDFGQVRSGIIQNNQLSAAAIEANKKAFAEEFTRRAEFRSLYDPLSNFDYVERLFQTTGINVSANEKQALVEGLNNQTETRASVLQKVVDGTVVIAEGNQQFTTAYGQAFYEQEFNAAFVLMEYFGYLHRDPDAPGYQHWLDKLNLYGNYIDAEMVRSFITSPEYRARFGQP